MTCEHGLVKLHDLVNLLVETVFVRVMHSFPFQVLYNALFQVFVPHSLCLNSREEITNQSLEQWDIFEHELWHVHVSQGPHED